MHTVLRPKPSRRRGSRIGGNWSRGKRLAHKAPWDVYATTLLCLLYLSLPLHVFIYFILLQFFLACFPAFSHAWELSFFLSFFIYFSLSFPSFSSMCPPYHYMTSVFLYLLFLITHSLGIGIVAYVFFSLSLFHYFISLNVLLYFLSCFPSNFHLLSLSFYIYLSIRLYFNLSSSFFFLYLIILFTVYCIFIVLYLVYFL